MKSALLLGSLVAVDHARRPQGAAVEVQARRGAAGAIVAAPHDSHGIRRIAILADPMGSLRDPQAVCARQHRSW